jgi:uncharacterized protein YdeI (YjbR/CyaY-like superfamily)
MARGHGPVDIGDTLYVATREEWRAWLDINHDKMTDVWLIYYKAGSGKSRIPYSHAVEEALCFGWIDGIVRSIDEEKYAQRFTPRKKGSNWSDLNISKAETLIQMGRMTPAGLSAYKKGLEDNTPEKRKERASRDIMPADLSSALKNDRVAGENFEKFAQSYQRHCYRYVNDAKRPEIRRQRIDEILAVAAENKKIDFMRPKNRATDP